MYLGNPARTPFLSERVATEPPNVVWSVEVGSAMTAPPIVTEQLVIAAARDRYVYVLSRQNGSQYWREKLEGPPAHPIVSGHTAVTVTEEDGELRVIDLKTNDDLWKERMPPVRRPPALAGDTVFVATEDRRLFALHTGQQMQIWQQRFPRPPVAGPLLADNVVLYATIDSVFALTRQLGTRSAVAPSDEVLVGELAASDSQVYAATENGSILAWQLPQLRPIWRASGFGGFIAGPVIAGAKGYAISGSGELVEFDSNDGAARILARLPGSFAAAPAIVENGILVASLNGYIYMLDRRGERLWDIQLEASIEQPVSVQDGRILVAAYGPVEGALGIDTYRGRLLELQ